MMMIELTDKQKLALNLVEEWFNDSDEPYFYLAGYAGTGKTTICKEAIKLLNLKAKQVVYCAFTGKAVRVLMENGCKNSQTLHSLIYNAELNHKNELVFVKKNYDEINFELIVLDECSMVNEELFADLLSFEIPVLILGDPGQLPPISGHTSYGEPNIILDEVHRQKGKDIILYQAHQVRKTGKVDPQIFGKDEFEFINDRIFIHDFYKLDIVNRDVIDPTTKKIIVGRNATRMQINREIHARVANSKKRVLPFKGQRIMCLQNHKRWGLLNGAEYKFIEAHVDENATKYSDLGLVNCIIEDDYGRRIAPVINFEHMVKTINGDYNRSTLPPNTNCVAFDYSYAITCHKSQGSQWNEIMIVDESESFKGNEKEWLYTAITRAKKCVNYLKEKRIPLWKKKNI